MASKVYTAQEMRDRSKEFDEYLNNTSHYAIKEIDEDAQVLSSMLRQAADAIELITKLRQEIEGMETAPLDGVPEHMNINAKVTLAKLEFYKKVSALGEFPKCEEEQKKTVEFKRAGRTYSVEDMRKVAWGKMSSSVSLTFDERDIANMLLKGADAIEREARRGEKTYEYAERFADGSICGFHKANRLSPLRLSSVTSCVVRREVGTWEEDV